MAIKCCNRPNGNIIFGVIVFATAAFVLSRYAANTCDYLLRSAGPDSTFSTGGTVDEGLEESIILGDTRAFGIWGFEDQDSSGQLTCFGDNSFPSGFEFDSKLKAVRAFTVITAVLGGCTMLVAWFSTCLPIGSKQWKVIGLTLLITSMFEGLCLLLFRSYLCQDSYTSVLFGSFEPDCKLGSGAKCNICAIVFWFVAAVICMAIPEPTLEPIVVKQTVVTTETIQPNGTRVVRTETTTEPA